MFKKLLVCLITGVFIFGMGKFSFAQDESVAETKISEVVNVGNKICPVSGEKVGQGGMEIATYEYKGKVYNFCCTACIEEFKKDPEKYIKKIEEEKQKEKAEEKAEQPGTMHEEHSH